MKSRPAETTAGLGSVALLLAYVLGIDDPDLLVGLGATLGLVPGGVTLLVTNGGIRGVLRKLWRGGGGYSAVEALLVVFLVLVILLVVFRFA